MGTTKKSEMAERVWTWLSDEGWAIQKQSDPKAHFNYLVEVLSGVSLNVIQPMEGGSDKVVVASNYDIDQSDMSYLRGLDPAGRDRFLWDLKILLTQVGIQFNMVGATGEPDGEDPARIVVLAPAWFDGLTKNVFMHTVDIVKNGLLLVGWTFARAKGAPLSGESDPMVR